MADELQAELQAPEADSAPAEPEHPEDTLLASPISGIWLEVMTRLMVRCHIGGFPEGFDYPEADGHLRTLANAEASAATALSALREAGNLELETRESDAAAHVAATFQQRAHAHAFLVAADAFWDALGALAKVLPKIDELALQLRATAATAASTKDARDHEEHRTERVRRGRIATGRARRQPMTAEEFRRSPGVIDGITVTYGTEVFDLEDIYVAMSRVGATAGRRLSEILTLNAIGSQAGTTFTVTWTPSVSDDPFMQPLPAAKRQWEGRPPWAPEESNEA